MQILEIKVLKGPNYWSIRRPNLIQMKLDLEDLEYRPSNKIEGFRERIEQLIPTLIEHQCSEGHRGGFFKRVEDGTWMGHIIEHIPPQDLLNLLIQCTKALKPNGKIVKAVRLSGFFALDRPLKAAR